MVGEVQKRARRRELLALKEKRSAPREQKQRRHGLIPAWTGQLMAAETPPRVRYLIVVVNKDDELIRRNVHRRRSPAFLPAALPLALVQVTPFDRREQFLRLAQIIGIIAFVVSGQRNHGTMVEIVIPNCIKAVSAILGRAREPRFL